MAQVVYRGVKYDTAKRPNQQSHELKTFVETYRGVKHEEKVEVVSWHNHKKFNQIGFL